MIVAVIWFYILDFLENQPPIKQMSLIFWYRNLKGWTLPTHAPTEQNKNAKKYDEKRKKLIWRASPAISTNHARQGAETKDYLCFIV